MSEERLGPFIVGTGRRLRYPPGFFDKSAQEVKPVVTELPGGQIHSDRRIMSEELKVTLIGAEIVRLRLEPGDMLVVSHHDCRHPNEMKGLRTAIQETFGVPALVLTHGIKLEAILSVSPECQEMAADVKAKAAEEHADNMRKVLESLTKEPAHA